MMKEFENNAYFWQKVDTLYSSGDFKVTNKEGSNHKDYQKYSKKYLLVIARRVLNEE